MSISLASFQQFGLKKSLINALIEIGFESPSPIQQQSIPVLLEGNDLIAQAQTGTGKTAAFALPILQKLDCKLKQPQALILTPTRELAIQVAEAIQSYAKNLPGFLILPVYGGQDYEKQLRGLKRGAHVIVGTPGRLMDHMRRGTLKFSNLSTVVLDEADEMLRMGFLEDVHWILEQIPHEHQACLFSATMPSSIKKIANDYLSTPKHIKIEAKAMTAEGIQQQAMLVSQQNKLEALTRYLEVEDFNAALVFSRTKTMAAELAERLSARGYCSQALHGDMSQSMREKVIDRVKRNKLDIIVATDVAARGLDVERITHVINYDAPYDVETYTHRIGRTGRAGRSGQSLLILTPRERHFLAQIERGTNKAVDVVQPPTAKELSASRVEFFSTYLTNVLNKGKLDFYRQHVTEFIKQMQCSELDVAAALLKIAQKDRPLIVHEDKPLLEKTSQSRQKVKSRSKPKAKSRPKSKSKSKLEQATRKSPAKRFSSSPQKKGGNPRRRAHH